MLENVLARLALEGKSARSPLAEADTIDSLEVLWVSGEVSTFSDVPTRQRVTVLLPE